jgi:hypothetical protein
MKNKNNNESAQKKKKNSASGEKVSTGKMTTKKYRSTTKSRQRGSKLFPCLLSILIVERTDREPTVFLRLSDDARRQLERRRCVDIMLLLRKLLVWFWSDWGRLWWGVVVLGIRWGGRWLDERYWRGV